MNGMQFIQQKGLDMNRRDFLKKMLAVGGAVAVSAFAGTALFSGQDSSKANGEKKKMKILVLTGSPRKNGNSNTLAEHFIKGAKEAGHTVVRFDAATKNVHPCIACNRCGMDGDCVFQDDFNFVREQWLIRHGSFRYANVLLRNFRSAQSCDR